MRPYYTAALTALALLLAGCIEEDRSNCAPSNKLVLRFDLRDANGTGTLEEKVNVVDAVVYDAGNRFVAHRRVTKDADGRFPDASFAVEPGEYRAVCWANVDGHTRMAGPDTGSPFDESYLETISGVTGSPLYYAPAKTPGERPDPATNPTTDYAPEDYDIYGAIVHAGKVTVKDMRFTRAHRRVTIYLKGYEEVHEAAAPSIGLNNIPMRSDFFLRTDPSRRDYESAALAVTTGDGHRLATSFNAMIAPFDERMRIDVVRSSDGEIVTTIDLREYVDRNIDLIEDINEFSIEVRYMLNGTVEITMPGWEQTPLKPEW